MESQNKKLLLDLYVTTYSVTSQRAIRNLKELLDEYVDDGYVLNITDVKDKPSATLKDDITVVPLLIKRFPLPCRRLLGDMSDKAAVLQGLGILPVDH